MQKKKKAFPSLEEEKSRVKLRVKWPFTTSVLHLRLGLHAEWVATGNCEAAFPHCNHRSISRLVHLDDPLANGLEMTRTINNTAGSARACVRSPDSEGANQSAVKVLTSSPSCQLALVSGSAYYIFQSLNPGVRF